MSRRSPQFAGLVVLLTLVLAALPTLAGAAEPGTAKAPKGKVLSFKVAQVGAPGNPGVGIVPFTDAIYKTCAEAPTPAEPKDPSCMEVGSVAYPFQIGQLEVTVGQYVDFLNTVDPRGTNEHKLWSPTEGGPEWPRFGQIDFSSAAGRGRHYIVTGPYWQDKPYGFANFLRSARFANSLSNGRVLSKRAFPSPNGKWRYLEYKVRLSPETEKGMYDMRNPKTTRKSKVGFVIPSQDEWIKSAYYDPAGGGRYSYWKYPTNPGEFGKGAADAPAQALLDPETGDLDSTEGKPTAIFHDPETPAPTWCSAEYTKRECATKNPFEISAPAYQKAYQGSLGSVGQARTPSPWGTLDQGGNAVEWTDTITPPPFGKKGARVWRRLHGGIANAPAYQLWLSAVGLQPQDNTFYTATYPWLGMRIGIVGEPKVSR